MPASRYGCPTASTGQTETSRCSAGPVAPINTAARHSLAAQILCGSVRRRRYPPGPLCLEWFSDTAFATVAEIPSPA